MLFIPLLSYIAVHILYTVGWLSWTLWWGIHHDHYFYGRGRELFKVKINGVTISFGLYIPIIGLAKVYRMVNGEKEAVLQIWQFFEYPIWKRAIAALGGVLFLTVIGICSYIALSYLEPESYVSSKSIKQHGIAPSLEAEADGFQHGDRIILVNGQDYERFSELFPPTSSIEYTWLRGNDTLTLSLVKEVVGSYYFAPATPPIVGNVAPGSWAEEIELRKDDKILSVNNINILTMKDVQESRANDSSGYTQLVIQRIHNNDTLVLEYKKMLHTDEAIGFYVKMAEVETYDRTFFESIIHGINRAFGVIDQNIRAFRKLFEGELVVKQRVAEPLGIANTFGSAYDIKLRTLRMFAMLCMLIAFLNLLPLPKAVFWQSIPLGFEFMTGAHFPERFYNRLVKLSYYIIIIFMVLIVLLDIIAFF